MDKPSAIKFIIRLLSLLIDTDESLPPAPSRGGTFQFGTEKSDDPGEHLVRRARPSLPDPRYVRKIIRQRQMRAKVIHDKLFADPAWDMLLDLTAACAEHKRVSVTSLCIASGVPPTTALRWITELIEAGLLQRIDDQVDRRRAFISLTDAGVEKMVRYFTVVT